MRRLPPHSPYWIAGLTLVGAVASIAILLLSGGDASGEAQTRSATQNGQAANVAKRHEPELPFGERTPLEIAPTSYREVARFTTAQGKPVRMFIGKSNAQGRGCHGLRTAGVIGYSCAVDLDDPNLLYASRTTVLNETYVSGIVGQNIVRVMTSVGSADRRPMPLRNRTFFLQTAEGMTITGLDAAGNVVATAGVLPQRGG